MDIVSIIQNINIVLISKVFFLILLAIFIIFIFMLVTKIRSFDKIVIIEGIGGGLFLKVLLYIYLFSLVFLFIATLVIV